MASRAYDPAALARESAQRIAAPGLRIAAHDWRGFDTSGQIARWDALAHAAVEPNPFLESWYLLPSLRALDPEGRVQLLCLEANGELAGLLPLRRERSYGGRWLPHWRGWVHANCFLGMPLVAPGCERAFWRALLEWADANAGTQLFLHLLQVPLGGSLFAALSEVVARQRRPAAVVQRYERAMLRSDLSPQAYFEQAVSHKRRKELHRREKRLAEQGMLVERQSDARGIDRWIEEFLALERRGWKGRAGSALASHPATEALFRQALRQAACRGRLERLSMHIDGRAIAMLSSFVAPPAAFGFKTAYDEDFARYSPGVFLQREFLEMLTREDIAWCDSCAAPDHPLIDHLWGERRPIGRISIGIGGRHRRSLFHTIARLETGEFPRDLS